MSLICFFLYFSYKFSFEKTLARKFIISKLSIRKLELPSVIIMINGRVLDMEVGAGCGRRLRPALMARHLAIATLYMYDQYISDQQH